MDTKLTLQLNKAIIERAKTYAASKKTSLSKLVEAYLDSITAKEKQEVGKEISPLVKSLSGIITFPENVSPKEAYSDHLANKYLNEQQIFVSKVEQGLKQVREGKTVSHEEALKRLHK
jgi:predicted transcriptional regulator